MSARRSRVVTKAIVQSAPATTNAADQVLQFDFERDPQVAAAPPAQPMKVSGKDDSIKQAIVRWLNEQL